MGVPVSIGSDRECLGGMGRRVQRLGLAIAAIPLLALGSRVAPSHWVSLSDWASIELRTRDVGTSFTPLVGPYSRYGWNHPGPMLFYVLAVPYRLFGSTASGLLIGALAINTCALGAVAFVLWRRGGRPGLVLGFGIVLVLARALGAGFLINPWNPYVIVFPMLAVVLLCWDATEGNTWALPLAVALGSFATQSHVGAAVGVAVPIATAAIFLRRQTRTLCVSVAVGLLCWVPPLFQEFQPNGGNLSTLVRFWIAGHAHVTGWSAGTRIVSAQLAIPAGWITAHVPVNPSTGAVDPSWHFPIALVLLFIATAVAAVRHDRQSLTLDVLALAMVGAAWVSASRVIDAPYDYIVQWIWIVGALAWIAIAWTGWRALPRRHSWEDGAILATGGALVIVLLTLVSIDAAHTRLPGGADERALTTIAPQAQRALRTLPRPILITNPADLGSSIMAPGVALLAIHAGIDIRLDPSQSIAVGSQHTIAADHARSVVVVAANAATVPYASDPEYRLLAAYDPLSPAERTTRATIDAEQRRVTAEGSAATPAEVRTLLGDLARARALDQRGPLLEIFLKT
jgi:hypothetical protein